MGTIRLQNVTKQFGGQVVLSGASLDLHSGQTVGVVGPNGAGKTTLFRLITGEIAPDLGTVTRSRDTRIGYLPQEPQIGFERTLHDEVISVFADVFALEEKMHAVSEQIATHHAGPQLQRLMEEYDRVNARFIAAGGYEVEQRLNEVLAGLSFPENDFALPMSALSGGQKCRAALAKLLLQDSTYLVLDEPTNHLDIDAVRWLERFLAGHKGGAAIISHDRYLLDRLADQIIEVERKQLTSYAGNYTNYARTRALREKTQDRRFEKDKAFVDAERAFIARHLAGQRTKEAQGRRKRLKRRLEAGEFVLEKTTARKTIAFDFDVEVQEGRTVFELDGISKCYDQKRLFENLTLQIQSGRRIGITGPNGTGKTTLLRVLLREIKPDAGAVRIDPKAQIGYYAQEAVDLDPDATALSEIQQLRPDLSERQVRSLLGAFLFTGDDVFKRIGALSGGEQSRIRLIKLLLRAPNVLVLDEPTNHLDIASREALEAALAEYPGTLVTVSHDRYFLDRIVDQLLVLRSGSHTRVAGNFSDYLALVENQMPAAVKQTAKTRQSRRPPPRKPKQPQSPQTRYDRMPLDELEARIMRCEQELASFDAQFADPSVCRDRDALARLRESFARIKHDLEQAEAAWNRRADEG